MSDANAIDLTVTDTVDSSLDGQTFQIHVVAPHVIRLYAVTLLPPDGRCPVVIAGERCGDRLGHAGKHTWQGGD
jgi:hypothetical protein